MSKLFKKYLVNEIIESLDQSKKEKIQWTDRVCWQTCETCDAKIYCEEQEDLEPYGWRYCEMCGDLCEECSIDWYNCKDENVSASQQCNGMCMRCLEKSKLHLHYVKSHPNTCASCGYYVDYCEFKYKETLFRCGEKGCDWECDNRINEKIAHHKN